jgi:tetratricopeptide (TPR) repeat protein
MTRVFRTDSHDGRNDAELAGFHPWTHDNESARHFAEEALKEDPKFGYAHEVMGFVEFGEGKDEEALNEFTQAASLDPNLHLSLFAKAMMSPATTSCDPADEKSFHDALANMFALAPQFAPAYVQLAKLALRRDDPQTALAVSRKPGATGTHASRASHFERGDSSASWKRKRIRIVRPFRG